MLGLLLKWSPTATDGAGQSLVSVIPFKLNYPSHHLLPLRMSSKQVARQEVKKPVLKSGLLIRYTGAPSNNLSHFAKYPSCKLSEIFSYNTCIMNYKQFKISLYESSKKQYMKCHLGISIFEA